MATIWSAGLWSSLAWLRQLQFPWRALLLPALFLPLLALPALAALHRRPWRLALAVAAAVVLNLPHTEPKRYLSYDDEFYAPESIARRGINTTTKEEYEPRWVEERPAFEAERLRGLTAALAVSELDRRSHRERYQVTAAEATLVETATFYYPGWTVLVDGAAVPVTPVPRRGTMLFAMPAGAHDVRLELRPTPVRRRALALRQWAALDLHRCSPPGGRALGRSGRVSRPAGPRQGRRVASTDTKATRKKTPPG